MGIGENIRRLRQQEGLSQAEFARRLGVTKETVSRWESNRTFLRKAHLENMVTMFGINADDILSEERGLNAAPTPQPRKISNCPPQSTQLSPSADSMPDYQSLLIPIYKVDRSGNGTTLRHAGSAYAAPDVIQRHPASIFIRMDYREMNKLYPTGSLLLVDQRMRPYNGCTVVALVDNAMIVIRRYTAGNNTIVLSSWSHDAPSPDLILDKRRIRIIGTVVFFQASHDTEGP